MAGNGIKGLVKDTAVYGVSSIAGRILNWLLVPLYTYIFTNPVEYGKVSSLYGYNALFLILLTYGMETGFFRFMNKDEENANTVYSTSLFSLACTSILFIISCFYFIAPISEYIKSGDHHDFVLMMAIIIALEAFMVIPFAHLRYRKKAKRFAGLKLFSIFLNIAFNLFFLIVCPRIYNSSPALINWFYDPSYGIGYIFLANLLSTSVTLMMLVPELTGFKYKIDFSLLKRILKYSLPLLILGLAGVINQTVTQLLYPHIFSDTHTAFQQLGIYNACLKITVIISMFTQAFRYAYEPFVFGKNKEVDNRQSYAQATKYFIMFALVVFLGVMLYMDILKHIVSPNYTVGIGIVPIAMLGEICFGIYFNLSLWYKLIDKTHYGATFSIVGCIITVSINLIFVPIYGYIASAWANLICNFTIMTISYFFGQKHYPVKYDVKNAFFYFGLALGLYFIASLPDIESEWLRLSYRSLLLVVFIGIVIKKDMPLRNIPFVNRYLPKKK